MTILISPTGPCHEILFPPYLAINQVMRTETCPPSDEGITRVQISVWSQLRPCFIYTHTALSNDDFPLLI